MDFNLVVHHECPVVLLSPADAPAEVLHPSMVVRSWGVRGTQGKEHLDRWDEYFKMLLQFPQDYFLLLDSDSYCLSPEIPKKFYAEPDVFWSCIVHDWRTHPSVYPKLAFQSPQFFHRQVLEKLVAVDRSKIEIDPFTPFQDWWLVALAVEGGVKFKHSGGVSFAGWNGDEGPDKGGWDVPGNFRGGELMVGEASRGQVLMHSIRHKDVMRKVMEARWEYVRLHP